MNSAPEKEMNPFEHRTSSNRDEIYKTVSEKMGVILEKAGISRVEKIAIKEESGEDSNSVFRIKCNGNDYGLKIFSNSTETNQFYINKKFSQMGDKYEIPTTHIIRANDDCDLLPSPWILWTWSVGQPINKIAPAEKFNAAVLAGAQLRKMHQIKVRGFGWPNAKMEWQGETPRIINDFLTKKITNLNEKYGNAFSDDELREILNITLNSKDLMNFNNPVMMHGDVAGDNIIYDSNKNSATFIDPGEIIGGDPMLDLANSQSPKLSPEFREGIMRGYANEMPLTTDESDRLKKWVLFRQCLIACRAVSAKDKDAESYLADARSFFEEIKK